MFTIFGLESRVGVFCKLIDGQIFEAKTNNPINVHSQLSPSLFPPSCGVMYGPLSPKSISEV